MASPEAALIFVWTRLAEPNRFLNYTDKSKPEQLHTTAVGVYYSQSHGAILSPEKTSTDKEQNTRRFLY